MQVAVVYDGPIPAPIAAGQEIAKLRVTWPDGMPVEVPLTAGTDVEQLGAFGRILASIKFLLLGSPWSGEHGLHVTWARPLHHLALAQRPRPQGFRVQTRKAQG